jgi:hypothetical protein
MLRVSSLLLTWLASTVFALGVLVIFPPPGIDRRGEQLSHQNPKAEDREIHKAKSLWVPEDSTGFFTLWTALFTATLAISTFLLWRSTRDLSEAGLEQLRLAREEFISSHRPKISVYGFNLGGDIDGDTPIPVTFRYVNIGDTNAHVIGFGSYISRHDINIPLPGDVVFEHQEIVPPIEVPSGKHGFRLTSAKLDPSQLVTLGEICDNDRLICVGYIIYKDGRGVSRQTGFCRRYDIGAGRWIAVKDDEYEYSY